MSPLRLLLPCLLVTLCTACIGPLAPYEPLITPMLPEPDCTDSRTEVDAQGRATEVPAPAQCNLSVELGPPGRR